MERDYWTCKNCSYGVSGESDSSGLLSKVDNHEEETGHTMEIVLNG